jgi:hypothetical protein
MAEVQQRYSANETAQLEALSDRLLASFKEASLDMGKALATKGLGAVSQLGGVGLVLRGGLCFGERQKASWFGGGEEEGQGGGEGKGQREGKTELGDSKADHPASLRCVRLAMQSNVSGFVDMVTRQGHAPSPAH